MRVCVSGKFLSRYFRLFGKALLACIPVVKLGGRRQHLVRRALPELDGRLGELRNRSGDLRRHGVEGRLGREAPLHDAAEDVVDGAKRGHGDIDQVELALEAVRHVVPAASRVHHC